jgi:predicted pyridoxine 5'-phosphate oxidase superfamily flavin-nucleotide-binding protein
MSGTAEPSDASARLWVKRLSPDVVLLHFPKLPPPDSFAMAMKASFQTKRGALMPDDSSLAAGEPLRMYHQDSRRLQDLFDSRRVADRLEQVQVHTSFTDNDKLFIRQCAMFFLATADADARPDCSYKGGMPGFVRVVDDRTLVFPDYNGNGMFRSLGNIVANPNVGLLFIDFEHPQRLRINGTATLYDDDPHLREYPGAQLIVRVQVTRIFPNCPRYIHQMRMDKLSIYTPEEGRTAPVPNWKRMDEFRDVLPQSEGTVKANLYTYLKRLERHNRRVGWWVQVWRMFRSTLRKSSTISENHN